MNRGEVIVYNHTVTEQINLLIDNFYDSIYLYCIEILHISTSFVRAYGAIQPTLCVTNRTRPKEPVPRVTPSSKSPKAIGVGNVLTSSPILTDLD